MLYSSESMSGISYYELRYAKGLTGGSKFTTDFYGTLYNGSTCGKTCSAIESLLTC